MRPSRPLAHPAGEVVELFVRPQQLALGTAATGKPVQLLEQPFLALPGRLAPVVAGAVAQRTAAAIHPTPSASIPHPHERLRRARLGVLSVVISAFKRRMWLYL